MNERGIRSIIHRGLREVEAIDPHSHLSTHHPGARSIADILLYHHVWIELVSSGMPQKEVTLAGLPQETADPGMDPLERVERAKTYFGNIRNTLSASFVRWILRDLFAWDKDVEASDMAELQQRFEQTASRAGWADEVFQNHCGIRCSISVANGRADPTGRILRAAETLGMVNIVSGKQSEQEILLERETEYGRDIRTAHDYRASIQSRLDRIPLETYRFLGAWVVPQLTEEMATDEGITALLGKIRDGRRLTEEESGSFSFFGLCASLEHLRKSQLRTIQVIVGAEVLPPHRSITQWSGRFPGAMARIAGMFEDFRFNLSSASDLFLHDIAILAKHVPNISVAGTWWHTLYPHYIRKALETRLDIVPANKIIAFFSDAYHCEWCYPKIKLVKSILEDILVERVVKGRYSLDTAVKLITTMFLQAPTAIYLQ
jgi:hypothetical protein